MGDEANPAMKPASSEQAVFAGALQRDQPEARAAYLDAACGTDSALRQRIEALLHAAESAGDFLEAPPTGLREDADSTLHMGEFSEKPGDKIGRYKLLQQIGEGGCGVVYMAEQLEPVRRRVALKVIKLGMDTRSVIARFEAERQALALMDHPNIAKVLDGGATQTGRLYFVMELVRGVRITEFCDEARLSTKARLQLFVQVCHAIQHAHQKGIIHRDLKPSNILVTVNDGAPVPKVIDFGIAKATGQRLTDKTLFTQFHAFIGTPAYISPEQAEMSSVDVDTRSDIYSLGVLLYELLTGCTPFDGEELLRSGLDEMRRVIRDDQPPRPSTRLATLGVAEVTELSGKRRTTVSELAGATRGDLDCIVMKCLEKDRSRRYETANGLTTDIQRYLHNEPVSARPPSAIYWLRKLARRNRGALMAATMVLVALLVALVTLATSNARIRHERNQKDQALKERGAALDAAREQLFVSLQSQAQARRHSGQMGQRFESLAALAEAARIRPDAQLRDSAIAAMAIPDVNLGPPWPNPEGVIGAFDAAFQRVARFSTNGTISIRSIPDNRELQRLEFNPDTSSDLVAFSPDGRFFANLRDRSTLLLWSCESGKSVFKSPPENCSTLAFSPDGRQLAVAQGTSIACFDLGTGDPIRQWPARGRPYVMKYDPAGRRLAIGYLGSNVVSIYEAETGVEQATLPIGADTGSSVGWHPEGDLLATGGSDGRIQLWDVTTQQRLAVLEGHVEYVTTLSFHPEGELLASGSWDGVVRLWQPSPGRLLMRLPMAGTMLFGSASRWAGVMMPDNEQLHHFEVITGGEYRTFLNHFPSGAGELREGEISPDGTLLVLAGAEGVRLWDIACGREVALLRMEDNIQACFISGGREMLSCGPIDGLQRWSIEPNPGPEGGLRIARPHRIPLPFGPLRMAKSSHEHFLAIVGESAGQSLLLDLRTESPLGPSMSHSKVGYVALTSQAERMVTSGWRSPCVKLWDATNSKLIKEFVDEAGIVFFTPDDRELIVANGKEIIFQNLNTFEINRRIPLAPGLYPGHVAFTADAKLMAMELAPGVIHLKETVSGRTVARLEDPYGDRSTWMSFTPDGTQLVVVARYASAIHRWDLRAIRARLKTMNLDWDWPEFPIQSGATAVSPTRKPLRVQVVEAAPPEFRQKSATNTPAGKP